MTITIDPKLEARLRERAEAEGVTVSAYVERLVNADQAAEEELEALAVEGLNSGPAIEVGPAFWEELHRELDDPVLQEGFQMAGAMDDGGDFKRVRFAVGDDVGVDRPKSGNAHPPDLAGDGPYRASAPAA
jgi:hypothetical protein